MRDRTILWWVLAACLLASMRAGADGCFAKEAARNALELRPVSIPSQRAIVSFRDGVEKLAVESALDAEGQSFGWILPVPAKPTKYAEASPGLLHSLSMTLKPEQAIMHDYARILGLPVLLALAVTIWAWVVFVVRPYPGNAAWTLALAVGVACILWYPTTRSTDTEAVPAAAGAAGVIVEDQRSVGGYEVYLLDAIAPDALNAWLESNGFEKLPEKGNTIVAAYIRDGWHFMAAKLRREGSGLCRPHPLALEFPVPEPVYPMRLTALAESSVYLELFVVADKRADNPLLSCEISDRFEHDDDVRTMAREGDPPAPGFRTASFDRSLAHSETGNYLWDGCTVTKLAGTLSPAQMDDDLRFAWKAAKPYRLRLHSEYTAGRVAAACTWYAWSIVLALGTLALSWLGYGKGAWLRWVLLVGLLAALAASMTYRTVLAKLPRVEDSRYKESKSHSGAGSDLPMLLDRLTDFHEGFRGWSREDVIRAVQDHLVYAAPISRHLPKVPFEETPGGVDFRSSNGLWLPWVYDESCIPSSAFGHVPHWSEEQRTRGEWMLGICTDADAMGRKIDGLTQNGRFMPQDQLIPALYACAEAPERCVEPFIRHLRTQRDVLGGTTAAFEVSVLALASRIVPPEKLSGPELDAFLQKVEEWYLTSPRGGSGSGS